MYTITRPTGEPPESVEHDTTYEVTAHLVDTHGGLQHLLHAARDRLANRPCRPDTGAITVTTETTADGAVHVTARAECTDPGCAFSAEVRAQRELLTAMLDGTRELVTEVAEQALTCGKVPAERAAAWTEHQQATSRALRGLIDMLEPYADRRPTS